MFTVCPKCALTLVVTAADLRVAQGYVRCGRCSNVFNALSRLSEDRSPAPAPSATPPAPRPPPPPEPKRYDDNTAEDEELEFNAEGTDLSQVFVEPPASPQFKAATGTFQALRDAEAAREAAAKSSAQTSLDPVDASLHVDIEPDVLADMAQLSEDRKSTLQESPGPLPGSDLAAAAADEEVEAGAAARTDVQAASDAEAAATARAAPVDKPTQAPANEAGAPVPPADTATTAAEESTAATDDSEANKRLAANRAANARRAAAAAAQSQQKSSSALETAHAIREAMLPRKRPVPTTEGIPTPSALPPRFPPRVWATGSAVLALVLLVQVVHHYRHDLAATATFNGPLTSVYRALGISIVPRWDPTTYEVRQLGAATDPDAPGQIMVRASVKNGARQAQPLPLLRVTLQDRFGNRIASRDVPPQAYLPRAIPVSSLLSAGQRIDADMAFLDPGSDAVGFEIDACLPAPGGGISCANDVAR